MPRDPNRIPEVLGVIHEVWKRYPDLRLGQLLINATNIMSDVDLYNLEDNDIATKLLSYGERPPRQ